MRDRQIALENTSTASRFDDVIERLLVGLLVFMPLACGARNAWTEEVVIALSGAIVLCFALKLVLNPRERIFTSWAYIPVALFLVIVLLQLVPVRAGLLQFVSPNAVAMRTELLSGASNAEAMLESAPLSFYPNATKHDLRLVLSIAAVFVVVLNVFNRPERIERLLAAVALIGGFFALIALVQNVFGNGRIYWFIPQPHKVAQSGPFINHNHFAQFMNLSIGAAVGWLCVRLHKDFAGRPLRLTRLLEYISSRSARRLWLFLGVISLSAATIFISLSRGGMVSLLVAGVFTTLLLSRQRSLRGRGWIMIVVAIASFVCVLAVGFDAVYDRFGTIQSFQGLEFRRQTLRDLAVSIVRFPLFGTGLGTHAVVYPMHQNIKTMLLFTHAENEYAQVLEEVGTVGLITLVVFGIMIWSGYVKSIRVAKRPICSAAYGLGFGLLAILIHSLSDYGQHIPANAFLSAIFCALLLRLGRRKDGGAGDVRAVAGLWNSRGLRVVVLVAVCGALGWALWGANNARVAEAYWKKAVGVEKGLAAKEWQGGRSEFTDLLLYAGKAVRYQPDNMHYRYCFDVFQWFSISKAVDSGSEEGMISEDSIPYVREIVADLNEAFTICPVYGPAHSMAGQIEKFILKENSGVEKIRRGFRLAPCDPICCFVAGRLDALEGKVEDCIPKFERAIEIKPALFKDVVHVYVNDLSRPDLAILAAAEGMWELRYVAKILDQMHYNDLADQAREKLRVLLETQCSGSDASVEDLACLAGIYERQRNYDEAIRYYRRVLELDYGQVLRRLQLARLLSKQGQIREAIHEARICLRLRPQSKAARKLIGDLSVLPGAIKTEQHGPGSSERLDM